MTRPGHWGKFDAALDSLLRATPADPQHIPFFKAAAHLLTIAQRFYLPNSRGVLDGKPLDDQVKDLVRLPYDVIAILSETHFIGAPNGARAGSWKITVAVDPHGAANERLGFVAPDIAGQRGIAMLSLFETRESRFPWGTLPLAACIAFRENDIGWDRRIGGDLALAKEISFWSGRPIFDEFEGDEAAVGNLCALLNLANVATHRVAPPEKMNKKRAQSGKRPLYDYHVLEVEGDRWDSPYVQTDTGQGVRSHLRRGHIRRLEDRSVWVRATFVHGSVPGFVDKDYDVRGSK